MSPLQQCRGAKGLELTDVRRITKISVMRLEQIEEERGRPTTRAEARLLGDLFGIPSHNFLPMSFAGCSDLDVNENEIVARED